MQEKNKYLLQKLDDLTTRSEQIRERIRILEFDMDKVRNQEIDKQAVLELFRYFKEMFDSGQPIEERKELVRLMVKDVVYDAKNHEIRISFYSMPIDTLPPDGFDERIGRRLVVDGRRTLQAAEVSLLVKLYRKRSMGALMSLGQPIDNTKPYQKGILSKYTQKTKQIPVLTV